MLSINAAIAAAVVLASHRHDDLAVFVLSRHVEHVAGLHSDYRVHNIDQGAAGIAMEYCGSVLSEVALGVELTTYVITKISFYGTIRLDFPDSACTNYTNTPIIVLRHEHVSEAHNTDKKE